MESGVLADLLARPVPASMEPWHFSHGEPDGPFQRTASVALQWSHGILAMERIAAVGPKDPRLRASMEPWHFSHGELGAAWPNPKPRGRFNGAMAF